MVSDSPAVASSVHKGSAHISPLTTQEVRLLLRQAKQTAPLLYPLFLCAVRTGMRKGELLGRSGEISTFTASLSRYAGRWFADK
jgi:integrase